MMIMKYNLDHQGTNVQQTRRNGEHEIENES